MRSRLPDGIRNLAAAEYEELVWHSRLADTGATRADRQRSYGRYRAAVPPMIAGRAYRLAGELAGAVDDATAAIARYDADLAGRAPVLGAVFVAPAYPRVAALMT